MFIIFILYCLGPKRVGYLSGTIRPTDSATSALSTNRDEIQKQSEEEIEENSVDVNCKTNLFGNETETVQGLPKKSSTTDLKAIEEHEQQQQVLVIGGTAELSDDSDSDDQIVNVQNVMDDLCNPDNAIDIFNDTLVDMSMSIIEHETNNKDKKIDTKPNSGVSIDDETTLVDNRSPKKTDMENSKINSSVSSNNSESIAMRQQQRCRSLCCCCCPCTKEPSKWIPRIFIVSGIIVITASILLVVFGVFNLQRTIDTYNTSAQTISQSTTNATILLTSVIEPIQQQLVSRLVNYSTELVIDTICPGISLDDNTNDDQLSPVVNELLNVTVSLQNTLQSFATQVEINIGDQLVPLMEEATATADNIIVLTSRMDILDWEAYLFAGLYVIVPILLLASTIMVKYNKVYRTCIVWLVFPLFVILIIVATILCSIGIMSNVANSDLCYSNEYDLIDNNSLIPTSLQTSANINNERRRLQNGSIVNLNSPDATMLLILQNSGYPIDSNGYKIASFYISQCSLENPLYELEEYIPIVVRFC
jgi:hypothetical protein